jgi:hypothetical protein
VAIVMNTFAIVAAKVGPCRLAASREQRGEFGDNPDRMACNRVEFR